MRVASTTATRDPGHIFVAPRNDIVPLLAHPVPGLSSNGDVESFFDCEHHWDRKLTAALDPRDGAKTPLVAAFFFAPGQHFPLQGLREVLGGRRESLAVRSKTACQAPKRTNSLNQKEIELTG